MAQLPDGMIFEFNLDRKGVKLDVIKRDLVYCKHCKNAIPSINWCGEVSSDQVHCNYGLGSLRKLNDFCSSGEKREEEFENQKI